MALLENPFTIVLLISILILLFLMLVVPVFLLMTLLMLVRSLLMSLSLVHPAPCKPGRACTSKHWGRCSQRYQLHRRLTGGALLGAALSKDTVPNVLTFLRSAAWLPRGHWKSLRPARWRLFLLASSQHKELYKDETRSQIKESRTQTSSSRTLHNRRPPLRPIPPHPRLAAARPAFLLNSPPRPALGRTARPKGSVVLALDIL